MNSGLKYLKENYKPFKSQVSVLFTSTSSAGAWQIRGEQVSYMRSNWRAINKPNDDDLEECDILCVVKKPDLRLINKAKSLGKIVIYDIVDSWAQPGDGEKYNSKLLAKKFFEEKWKDINADGYIFPTRKMKSDLGFLTKNPITIYHHYWPQISINPINNRVKTIGYEGAEYLGQWKHIISDIADKLGIEFISNPRSVSELDIVVLARGGVHGNYLSRNYKSNVKLANALASGTPALVHYDEMSAHDTDTGSVLFFSDTPYSFERQLDRLVNNFQLRKSIHHNFLLNAPKYSITSIATQYDEYFSWMVNQSRTRK